MICYLIVCRLLVGAVLVAAMGLSLYAQSPSVSIGGGYERGQTSIRFNDIDSCCREDEFKSGVDQAVATVGYSFKLFRSQSFVFDTRLTWSGSDVMFATTFPRVNDGATGRDLVHETVSFSMQLFQLELLLRSSDYDRMQVALGPVIGYRSIDGYKHTQTGLDDASHAPISQWSIQDYALERVNNFMLGALVTVGYEFPLTNQLLLVPELRLRGDFISAFTNTDWTLLSAGASLLLRYSLYPYPGCAFP